MPTAALHACFAAGFSQILPAYRQQSAPRRVAAGCVAGVFGSCWRSGSKQPKQEDEAMISRTTPVWRRLTNSVPRSVVCTPIWQIKCHLHRPLLSLAQDGELTHGGLVLKFDYVSLALNTACLGTVTATGSSLHRLVLIGRTLYILSQHAPTATTSCGIRAFVHSWPCPR